MLPIKQIQERPDEVIEKLKVKNFDASQLVPEILDLDQQRKNLQMQSDQLLADLNATSKAIGQLFKEGKQEEANAAREKTAQIKEQSKTLKDQHAKIEHELNEKIVQLPNIPHPSVPAGNSEEQNELLRSGGTLPTYDGKRLAHWDLAKNLQLIDFELGVKITGAGFPVYRGAAARLQRALINFFLDEGVKAGYLEMQPPILVNEDSAFATGQLPDKEGQMYQAEIDNLYLIPTAEVPITNILRDVILKAEDLPVKYVAYTPCFRREAGSWGSHVRGLNRLHQFDKVEIVQVRHPEDSYQGLDEMVAYVESLINKLGLQYRIMRLCGGDLSFTSALTFDFEVFAAGQERWLEVSSVSNFEAFQANRLKLRFKDQNEKRSLLAHTLNGSALALPRILAAILENYQTENGISIPTVLQPYTGFDHIGS